MSSAPNEAPTSSSQPPNQDESARFECNICLDAAKDAVVSLCGHLFCWPCLSQWLDTRPHNQTCPVCKSAIDGTKVVPIYGRGGDSTDPRSKVPPRPKGTRSEAHQQSFPGFNWGNETMGSNVHFSFGIGTLNGLFPLALMLPLIQGIFPLSFVASFFGAGGAADAPNAPNAPNREGAARGSRMAHEEEYLSNIFKYIGIFMLVWLFFM